MTDDELDAIERRAKDAWAEVQCSAPGSRGNLRDDLAADVLRDVDSLVAELRRLRKIFDDAGQGEHNILALIEHYQDGAMNADERVREAQAQCDLRSAQLSMVASAIAGDPKLHWMNDRGDPRWTPALEDAWVLRQKIRNGEGM